MKKRALAFATGLALLVPAYLVAANEDATPPARAGAVSTAAQPPPVASPSPLLPTEQVKPARSGLAAAAVAAAESAAGERTQLAVEVLDRTTGEVAAGDRAGEPFYTASLSKIVVAVDVLDRRRTEGLRVTDADLDLLRRALGPSDDNAMSALWSRFDGAGAAGRVAARLGLDATTAPDDTSQWGEMAVSAADMVTLWRYVLEDMPDGDLVVTDMAAAPARAASGFDQAFGLLAPDVDGPGGPGAVAKQGWMCCFSGVYYLHSVGAVGADERFVVVLLTRVPSAPGWESARQELDRIARAAVAPLG